MTPHTRYLYKQRLEYLRTGRIRFSILTAEGWEIAMTATPTSI